MVKEKVKKYLNGNGNNKKKIENLIFLLIILVVTIISINYIWNDKDSNKEEMLTDNNNYNNLNLNSDINQNTKNEDNLEKKLEDILSKIDGVGNTSVMITYSESTQFVPVYNKTEKVSTTDESDSGGGKRNIEEKDISEEVVYTESNGKSEIATQKNISPKIEGAIIISEGAGDDNIKTNIIQAVEAATGLPTHKIQVFKKQN